MVGYAARPVWCQRRAPLFAPLTHPTAVYGFFIFRGIGTLHDQQQATTQEHLTWNKHDEPPSAHDHQEQRISQVRRRLSLKGRLLLLLLCLVASYGGWHAGRYYAKVSFEPVALRLVDPPHPLAPFNLVDQFNNPANLDAMTGHWSVLFAGSSTNSHELRSLMARLTRVHNRLAENAAMQGSIRYVMVAVDPAKDTSVDPIRDTPTRMTELLEGYSRSFICLTGDAIALESFLAQPALTPTPSPASTQRSERFTDGARLFVSNPAGAIVAEFTRPFNPVTIADELKRLDDLSR